jgi:hypothetical protein
VSGVVREGSGDPLSGGVIEGRWGSGRLRAGRLAPRWGRGLVLGTPAEPWSAAASDRGRSPFRGRAGEGVCLEAGSAAAVELMAGRFARSNLVGLGARGRRLGAGALTDGSGRSQATAFARGDGVEAEVAFDRHGRWRAEMFHARAAGSIDLVAHVRGGAESFRSIAEPLRSGPARAATLMVGSPNERASWSGLVSWWRFAPGYPGARAMGRGSLATAAGDLAAGIEAQRGTRRWTSSRLPLLAGARQGAWAEWSKRTPRLALGLRHELWGERGLALAVRRASGMRVEAVGPLGVRARLAHTVFHARFGESLYLSESYSDRDVLRALTGDGERTHVEVAFPAAGGWLTASVGLTRVSGRATRALWIVDWARRARTR